MKKTHKSMFALIILILMATPAIAQDIAPFTDYLPADTFMVISVPQTMELKAFLDRPEIKKLVDLFLNQPEVAEGFAEFKQKFHEKTGITTEEIYGRLDGDMTLAMLSFPDNNGTPDIVVTFGMRGGADAITSDLVRVMAAAAEDGKEIKKLNIAGHDVFGIETEEAYFAEAFGHFMIASTPKAIERLFGDEPRINAEPGFARHRELVGLNEGFSIFLNFAPLNRMLEFHVQMEMENEGGARAQATKAVLEELGLDKINGISLAIPFKSNSSARMFVHAPGYDGFLAKIFSTAPVDRGIATALSANTDSLVAISLNKPEMIMNYFVDLMMQFNPGMTPEMFEATLEEFKQQTGIDIRNDLVASLGTNMAFGTVLKEDASLDFRNNPFAMFQSFEFDLVWQLSNRAGFETALNNLMTVVMQQMPDAFASEMYKGSSIHELAWGLPGAALSMEVNDGLMRLATRDTASLKALIDGLTTDANVASTMGFRQAIQKIPAGANMVSYVSPDYYRKYVQLSMSMLNETDMEQTPEEVLQFLDVLKEGVQKVAAKGRSYSGYAIPTSDGLYGEGEIDLADQLYIFMLEMTKYFMYTQTADYGAPTASN